MSPFASLPVSCASAPTLTLSLMCRKLEDWSSDEDDAAANAARSRKYRGIVVLEGMFSLQELEEDPTLLLDLKEDVREECETLGEVTNVTLYDVSSVLPSRSGSHFRPLTNRPPAERREGDHVGPVQGRGRCSSLHGCECRSLSLLVSRLI